MAKSTYRVVGGRYNTPGNNHEVKSYKVGETFESDDPDLDKKFLNVLEKVVQAPAPRKGGDK